MERGRSLPPLTGPRYWSIRVLTPTGKSGRARLKPPTANQPEPEALGNATPVDEMSASGDVSTGRLEFYLVVLSLSLLATSSTTRSTKDAVPHPVGSHGAFGLQSASAPDRLRLPFCESRRDRSSGQPSWRTNRNEYLLKRARSYVRRGHWTG